MTLKAIFRWKNPDSTADLNLRQANLILRGVSWGGDIQPGAGLTINVTPSVAHSLDGMTVLEDANTVLNVAAGQVNVVVLHAQYNPGGSPAQPTLNWHVYEESVYNLRPDKDYLIVYGKVTLAGGATAVTNNDIDMADRDEVTAVGRNPFRGQVATPAALPTAAPNRNKDGDFYYVFSTNTFYFWDGSAWNPQTSGAFSTETADFNRDMVRRERDRVVNGSGVISGTGGVGAEGFARNTQVSLIPDASQDSMMGFDSFEVAVNGHVIETYAQLVQMDPKADRYDMVFLEVWREETTDPDNVAYERNPDGSTTYTIKQASDQYEQMLWTSGLIGNNFNINELGTDDHKYLVTKYRFGKISGCGQSAIAKPSDPAVVALALNIDANTFTAPSASSEDNRTWYATSTTAYDGVSWAIPLVVIRRTTLEDHTGNAGIQVFRLPDNNRWIFPVYPVADIDNAARENLETQNFQDAVAFKNPVANKNLTYPNEKPSGFLTGMDYEIGPGSAANTIQFYNEPFKVRVRGIEDWVDFSQILGFDTELEAPPAAGYTREFVYLKMNITLFANSVNKQNYWISPKHRPLFPTSIDASFPISGQGYKRGYVQWELVADQTNATAADAMDEDDAMVANGFQRGDDSLSTILPGSKFEFQDGGIWSKPLVVMADDRVHPLEAEWAIPICLIHRRNSTNWDRDTNPNGTGLTRPDGRDDATVLHADDLVDLRRLVDVDEAQLKVMLEGDLDKLMKGRLRTRMAQKWAGAGAGNDVAGSRILQTDVIGAGTSAFELTNPDGFKKIWSDAREFQLISVSFNSAVSSGGPTDSYQYTFGAPSTLIIRAPAGAQIVRSLPPVFCAEGAPANVNYKEFLGQPCWSTSTLFNVDYPTPLEGKYIDSTDQENALVLTTEFAVSSTDGETGKAKEMTASVGAHPLGSTIVLSWWVHYDRSPNSGSGYLGNYGLSEIPDTVHKLTKGPTTGTPVEVNLGVPYAVVRKTFAAVATATITLADVQAVTSVPGIVTTFMGLDYLIVNGNGGNVNITSAQMTDARDEIEVTLGVPYTGDAEFTVFFITDEIESWVEIGRGGKSVRAYYEWHEESIDHGGPPAAPYAFDVGRNTWSDLELDGGACTLAPFVWTRVDTLPTTPWDLVKLDGTPEAGHRYSNLVSFTDLTANAQQYMLVVVPIHRTAINAALDYLQIDYTYTPYQGLSGAGAKADVVTNLPTLKKMLHGTVETNSDFYASQSGACSIYGGVDTFTGKPARNREDYRNSSYPRFQSYNQTWLVKSASPRGTRGLSMDAAMKENLYTAAILRLPYPGNPDMFVPLFNPYHPLTMDFDIDPGREGASAGFYSYAPGYPGIIQNGSVPATNVIESQFFNAPSRLAVQGETLRKNHSKVLHSCEYEHDPVTGSPVYVAFNGSYLNMGQSNHTRADAPVGETDASIVGLVGTFMDRIETGEIQSVMGIRITSPSDVSGIGFLISPPATYLRGDGEANFPGGPFTNSTPIHCVCGGSVLAYYSSSEIMARVLAHVDVDAGAAPANDRYLYNARVIRERWGLGNSPDEYQFTDESTDLIRIPFGGSASRSPRFESFITSPPPLPTDYYSTDVGFASLRGIQIAYPSSWGASTITTLEGLIQPSELFHSAYGRGIYLGSPVRGFTMPTLVPGTGHNLAYVLSNLSELVEEDAQAPAQLPTYPSEPVFASGNRRYYTLDKGGPIAYVFYGMVINPEDNDYMGRAVMQISGGPTMELFDRQTTTKTAATALDAFWPSKRPVLKNK